MKKVKGFFSKVNEVKDEMFLNVEKITILNRKQVFIQNYDEVEEIKEEYIKLRNIVVTGKLLRIKTIIKYFLEIVGDIEDIKLLGDKNE
ncbi:MAG: hypothetical protein GX676_03270 [Bacilli bacterium]|nr:hypothetical protein [Bacilli bacterium]